MLSLDFTEFPQPQQQKYGIMWRRPDTGYDTSGTNFTDRQQNRRGYVVKKEMFGPVFNNRIHT